MKNSHFTMIGFLILVSGISCKKYDQTYSYPPPAPTNEKWIVTTVAGDGTPEFADGSAASAKFHFPNDVLVTNDGTIYVSDGDNSRIRKISGGQVSTFAGSDFGIKNGSGSLAEFEFPTSLAIDGNGNIYVSDVRDPRIRKSNLLADISTYAGIATEGFQDGNADAAKFGEEKNIVSDTEGNLYVADAQNNSIRKISVSGNVTTIAGTATSGFQNGSGGAAKFNFPDGIAIDAQGNLFISDGSNFRIRKITPQGEVSTFAGTGTQGWTDGTVDKAQFQYPGDMVADKQGNLYVIDLSRIRKITPQGVVTTIAGSEDGYADGEGASAKFYTPFGIGIDSQGNIYVADTNNNRIRKISLE